MNRPGRGYQSGDTPASQLPPPPTGVRQDPDELARRKATAEFLRAERERYEYLLLCAKDAEHEELAWETIVTRMTVEDFVVAAKEVLAGREVVEGVRNHRFAYLMPSQLRAHEATCADCRRLAAYDQATGRPDPAAGHGDLEEPP